MRRDLIFGMDRIEFRDLKTFLTEHAATLKAHAQAMAEKAGRPYIYLAGAGTRKEQRACRACGGAVKIIA